MFDLVAESPFAYAGRRTKPCGRPLLISHFWLALENVAARLARFI